MQIRHLSWPGMALCFALVSFGCKGRGCTSSSGPAMSGGVQCQLELTFGETPRWGAVCEDDRSCWRASRKRMRWTRCITGRCLFGASDAKRSHLMGVTALAMMSGGQLWSGDAGGEMRLWSLRKRALVLRWQAHKGPVRSVVMTARGVLITAGDDEIVRVWDVKGKLPVQRWGWKVRGRISSLALSSPIDGKMQWLAAASTDRRVWLRKLSLQGKSTGQWRHLVGHKDAVRSVAFAPDRLTLASASDDRTVRLWVVPGGEVLGVLRGHQGWVRRAVFGPKGSRWLASSSFDLTIQLWSDKGRLQQRWGRPVDPFAFLQKTRTKISLPKPLKSTKALPSGQQHSSDISDLAISPDGHWLLATGHRSTILRLPDDGTTARLWSRKHGRVACHLKGHQLGLTHGVFAPDGRRFATSSEDGTIRIYTFQKAGR